MSPDRCTKTNESREVYKNKRVERGVQKQMSLERCTKTNESREVYKHK